MADFARKRVAPLSTVKKILKDKDAIMADFEADQEEDEAEMEEQVEQEPTVNEIIIALRIVRKFSQKIILLKKSNLLGQLKINVKQSSLPTRGKSQLHLFCYRLLYINKLLHCYTTIKNVCMLNRAKRLTEPFPCFPTKATLCGRLLY